MNFRQIKEWSVKCRCLQIESLKLILIDIHLDFILCVIAMLLHIRISEFTIVDNYIVRNGMSACSKSVTGIVVF